MTGSQAKRILAGERRGDRQPAEHVSAAKRTAAEHYATEAQRARDER